MNSREQSKLQPTILIIGCDSLIGKALMLYLQKSKSKVLGTTRRKGVIDKSHIYLDLSKDVEAWLCPSGVSVAVICAGITQLAACKKNPIDSARINVQNISLLINNLVSKGIFVIYLSTDKVFDGTKPYRSSGDAFSPITEYGRQKADTESRINHLKKSLAIVRLTKVLSPEDKLFSGWRKSLSSNKPIYPFSDMVMSPVPLYFVVKVLSIIAEQRLSGIFQISGNGDVSYAETARRGAELLGVSPHLIRPVAVKDSGNFTESVPKHTTLNIDRIRTVMGIEPPDVWWTIEKIFTKPDFLGKYKI